MRALEVVADIVVGIIVVATALAVSSLLNGWNL